MRKEEYANTPAPPVGNKMEYMPVDASLSMHHQDPSAYQYDGMHQMAPEDYDDLMPDPMQFVSLMGAPPPPPMVPPPQQQRDDKNEPVLPPGIPVLSLFSSLLN